MAWGAVFAVSEHHLIELAGLKGALGACKVLCPDADKLALVLDKQRTLEVAASLGISVPQGWLPHAGEDFAGKAAGRRISIAPSAATRRMVLSAFPASSTFSTATG